MTESMYPDDMAVKLAEILASLSADIGSPRSVADLDKILVHIWDLRRMAADLHNDSTPPPHLRLVGDRAPEPAPAPAPASAPQRDTGGIYDGSVASLVERYLNDRHSPIRGTRHKTRESYTRLGRRIAQDHGTTLIKNINGRELLRWHQDWGAKGHIAMAHALMGGVRRLFSFGGSILEDPECQRLCGVLNKMRFKMSKPRYERLTIESAIAIRAKAHELGFSSIALAQAFQFESSLTQKDVLGEWVPSSEPGDSILYDAEMNMKWVRGLRWSEVDPQTMTLVHKASRDEKPVEIDLRRARMVAEELARFGGKFPKDGPIIICERTQRPWTAHYFRQRWREIAQAAGIPDTVRNMDSARAEADDPRARKDAQPPEPEEADVNIDVELEQRQQRLPH